MPQSHATTSEAMIASFILRFTQEHASGTDPSAEAWRGVIRHVQTSEEIRFTEIEDALAFIGRYLELSGEATGQEGKGNK